MLCDLTSSDIFNHSKMRNLPCVNWDRCQACIFVSPITFVMHFSRQDIMHKSYFLKCYFMKSYSKKLMVISF